MNQIISFTLVWFCCWLSYRGGKKAAKGDTEVAFRKGFQEGSAAALQTVDKAYLRSIKVLVDD